MMPLKSIFQFKYTHIKDLTWVFNFYFIYYYLWARDEKCETYLNSIRKEVITSSLTELNESIERCNIPSMNDLLEATKEQPIQWNAYESLQEKSSVQSEESFEEQKKL